VTTGAFDGSTCRWMTASTLAPAARDIDAVTVPVPDGLSAVIECIPADNVSGPTIL
jgi:hypothetical protein